MSYPNPINQSVGGVDSAGTQGKADMIDVMDETNAFMVLIRDNLEYEHHMKYGQYGEKEIYELVKSRFLKLNSGHVEYVMGCMKETTTKLTNIRAYLITALYNAPSTMSHYYQQEVQHDMYGGGWTEKGIT